MPGMRPSYKGTPLEPCGEALEAPLGRPQNRQYDMFQFPFRFDAVSALREPVDLFLRRGRECLLDWQEGRLSMAQAQGASSKEEFEGLTFYSNRSPLVSTPCTFAIVSLVRPDVDQWQW
jgi:hypothetical protein